MANPSFDGKWNTEQFGELELTVNGNAVTGTFGNEGGTVSGLVYGPFLRKGRWTQRSNDGEGTTGGDFQLTLDPTGLSFQGTWTYDNPLHGSGGTWNGTRVLNPGR